MQLGAQRALGSLRAAPGRLRLASSARRVPARSGTEEPASACHPRLGRQFPACPICRARQALCPSPPGGRPKKQPEFQTGGSEQEATLLLGWVIFLFRPECAWERGITPRVRTRRSQIRLSPLLAAVSRAPPVLASFFFCPRYSLSFSLSVSSRPVATSTCFLRGATRLASKGWLCSERQTSPRLSRLLPVAEPWRPPVAWLR